MKQLSWQKLIIGLGLSFLLYFFVNWLIVVKIITPYYASVLYWIGIYIILGLSLNLIVGLTGQLSLGHGGFMALGAYSTAILTLKQASFNNFWLGVAIGMLVSGLLALLVAIPTLRLKGDYLAITTLGVSEIIRIIILNLKITGGARGLYGIPYFMSWPLVYGLVLVVLLISYNFKYSTFGRVAQGIKEDEIAVESLGISPFIYKTLAFILGAMIAALAGALYASTYYVIKPESFGINTSINILIIVVFGGMGSLSGTVLAAFFVGITNMLLQSYGDMRTLIYALILVLAMIFRPQGLLGTKELSLGRFKNFKKAVLK